MTHNWRRVKYTRNFQFFFFFLVIDVRIKWHKRGKHKCLKAVLKEYVGDHP